MDDSIFHEKFAELAERVRRHFENAPNCHDFDHTLRVLRNAELLAAELPAASLPVVRLAALLHDIARAEEIAGKGRRHCHAERGAELTPQFLAGFGLPEPTVAHIAAAVRTHRFRDNAEPATLEAEIVYDADKLDSLGAVGIGRSFLFAGREGARLHNRAEEALAAAEYSREDTAYREYLVKLSKLPAAMRTEPGKRIAAERAKLMDDFFQQLNMEAGGL